MKAAMRARDATSLTVLRGVLAALKNRAIELQGGEPSEADVTAVIKRERKQCRESIEGASKAGRGELIAEHEARLAVLETLLPAQLSEEELRAAIESIIADTGATSIGPVMKELTARHAGLYDGRTASKLVGECLSKGESDGR